MATANYMTMENFPLFVKEFNTQIKRCPACGLYQDCENERFSNGEALYGRVENTSRAKLMQAVSPRV